SPRRQARPASPQRIRRCGGPTRPWPRGRCPQRWPRACASARASGCRPSRGTTRRARPPLHPAASMHRLRSRRGCRLRPGRGAVPGVAGGRGVPAPGFSWNRAAARQRSWRRPILPPGIEPLPSQRRPAVSRDSGARYPALVGPRVAVYRAPCTSVARSPVADQTAIGATARRLARTRASVQPGEDFMAFIVRLLITAAALWVAEAIVPGIEYDGGVLGLLGVALVFGIVNAVIRPILLALTCPIVLLTLGL